MSLFKNSQKYFLDLRRKLFKDFGYTTIAFVWGSRILQETRENFQNFIGKINGIKELFENFLNF